MDKTLMKGSTLREQLSRHLHADEIRRISDSADGNELYSLLFEEDKRTSDNAAWVMTHLSARRQRFLQDRQAELIDEVMRTTSTTKRRLLLTLLEKQRFSAEDTRTDFLDFCLEQLASVKTTVGVKSVSMKLAYKQCLPYPELRQELQAVLELMPQETMTAGLRCAQKNILQRLNQTDSR